MQPAGRPHSCHETRRRSGATAAQHVPARYGRTPPRTSTHPCPRPPCPAVAPQPFPSPGPLRRPPTHPPISPSFFLSPPSTQRPFQRALPVACSSFPPSFHLHPSIHTSSPLTLRHPALLLSTPLFFPFPHPCAPQRPSLRTRPPVSPVQPPPPRSSLPLSLPPPYPSPRDFLFLFKSFPGSVGNRISFFLDAFPGFAAAAGQARGSGRPGVGAGGSRSPPTPPQHPLPFLSRRSSRGNFVQRRQEPGVGVPQPRRAER